MNILPVYPEFPDTFWSFKHALKFIDNKAGATSFGSVDYLSDAALRLAKRLVDLNVSRLTDEDLAQTDYVFMSAMIVQRDLARQIIQRCKTAGVKVRAGGPLFTMEYDQFPEVDHFVLSETDETL